MRSPEKDINRAEIGKIGLHAVAGQYRIEAGAGAGRDDLARLQAAARGGLLVGELQQDVHGAAECAAARAGAAN